MKTGDEYQVFLQQVTRLTERRQNLTAVYVSVNAAIVGAITLIYRDISMLEWGRQLSTLALFAIGIIACDIWRRLIVQYTILLGWWYEQLRALEADLSQSKKLVTKEYLDLYQAGRGKSSIGLTRYEIRLSWLFTAGYATFSVIVVGLLVFGLTAKI